MINKIEFLSKNLTSNAGLLLLLEHTSKNAIFNLIDHDLVFENASTNKTKMHHIKTMLCGNFIGIDKLEGKEYDYFFFVTNTEQSSEEVVDFYKKRGNCENYIKEAKYDMAAGYLLLQSFWANETIFQLMMLAYNLLYFVQNGLRRGNRISAADQDVPIEVHFLGRDDYQNGEKCGDEAF